MGDNHQEEGGESSPDKDATSDESAKKTQSTL